MTALEPLLTAMLGPKSTRSPAAHFTPDHEARVKISEPQTVKAIFAATVQPLGGIAEGRYEFRAGRDGNGIIRPRGTLILPRRGYEGLIALEVEATDGENYGHLARVFPQDVEGNKYKDFTLRNFHFRRQQFIEAVNNVAFLFNDVEHYEDKWNPAYTKL